MIGLSSHSNGGRESQHLRGSDRVVFACPMLGQYGGLEARRNAPQACLAAARPCHPCLGVYRSDAVYTAATFDDN